VITNDGNWEGHITQVNNAITAKTTGYKTFWIIERLSVLDIIHDKLMLRSIWFINDEIEKNTADENTKELSSGKRADFTIIAYSQLPKLFAGSITEDAAFVLNNPDSKKYEHTGAEVKYRKLIGENKMPSQKRTAIGLLYDKLTPKFLKNKIIQCLIEDRPKFYVVPINFYQDLEVYNSYKMPLCLQKIKSHQSKAVSNPDTFEKEANRLS